MNGNMNLGFRITRLEKGGSNIEDIDFSHSSVSSVHELLQNLANDIYPKAKPELIPTMTSDTEPYGTASSNYTYSGRYAWYGFRHNVEPDLTNAITFYYAGEPSNTNYLQYDFKEISTVTEITLKVWGTLEENHLKLSYINETDEVIDMETLAFVKKYNEFSDLKYDFGAPVKAKAIRITSVNGDGGLSIAQLQAYGE